MICKTYQVCQEKADIRSLPCDSAAMSPKREPWSTAPASLKMPLQEGQKNRCICETDVSLKQGVPRAGLTIALFVTGVGGLTAEKVTEESNVLLFAHSQVKVLTELSSKGVHHWIEPDAHPSYWFGPAGVSNTWERLLRWAGPICRRIQKKTSLELINVHWSLLSIVNILCGSLVGSSMVKWMYKLSYSKPLAETGERAEAWGGRF